MKKYPAYKDSGIEWIGEVPNHWSVLPLKRFLTVHSGDFHNINDNTSEELGYPIFGGNGLRGYSKKYNFTGEAILIGRVGAKCGNVHLVSGEYWISEHALRVIPKREYDNKLFKYLIERVDLNRFAIRTAQPLINTTIVESQIIGIPDSTLEQSQIANFLDHKIRQIDDLIEKKKKLIELLKEERTALINQAVTKGLVPNAPKKDSGNEWLGMIPENWEVSKIKYSAEINKSVLGDDTSEDYEFNYVDIGIVSFGKLNGSPEKLLFKNSPSRARRILHEGDTIISTVRTYLKAVLFIDNSFNEFIGSTGFAVITPTKRLVPKFLYYVMTSQQIIEQICSISVGVSYPATNASDIGNIPIWLPSIPEQEKIVNYIEEKIDYLTYIEKKSFQEIELISEYKTSLINEVVTGKIDVRDYKINVKTVAS